jgi:hypothetical protein
MKYVAAKTFCKTVWGCAAWVGNTLGHANRRSRAHARISARPCPAENQEEGRGSSETPGGPMVCFFTKALSLNKHSLSHHACKRCGTGDGGFEGGAGSSIGGVWRAMHHAGCQHRKSTPNTVEINEINPAPSQSEFLTWQFLCSGRAGLRRQGECDGERHSGGRDWERPYRSRTALEEPERQSRPKTAASTKVAFMTEKGCVRGFIFWCFCILVDHVHSRI